MKGQHFKLGLFVCVAAMLLVAFLLVLGVLDRFKPSLRTETYFNESIQNLQVGAPVRYRGIVVGKVTAISLAVAVYPEALELGPSDPPGDNIRVEMAFDTSIYRKIGIDDPEDALRNDVASGLRARLAMSGLGGPTFIEVDFMDPTRYPARDLAWTPRHVFVPSAPSQAGAIFTSLYSILNKLDNSDLIAKFTALAELGQTVNDLIARLESTEVLASADAALRELEATSASAGDLLSDPRLSALLDDASTTMRSARLIVEGREDDIGGVLEDLSTMANELERTAVSLSGLAQTVDESELIERLRLLADELGPAGADLQALASRLDRLIQANDAQIADTIRSLRDASNELEALLEELKANPSRVLSEPPPRRDGR